MLVLARLLYELLDLLFTQSFLLCLSAAVRHCSLVHGISVILFPLYFLPQLRLNSSETLEVPPSAAGCYYWSSTKNVCYRPDYFFRLPNYIEKYSDTHSCSELSWRRILLVLLDPSNSKSVVTVYYILHLASKLFYQTSKLCSSIFPYSLKLSYHLSMKSPSTF